MSQCVSILSPLGQAAIAYARRGWRVFPCQPRAKQPATKHGCRDATNELEQVARWWQQMPSANIGLATGPASGLWVLDVDAPDGIASLQALEQRCGKLPATLTQRTGSGGLQMFWRWPAGFTVRNSTRKLGPGLDTRGEGGYAVAPPSVHPNGARYAWLPGPTEPADAPAWLVDLVIEKPQQASTPSRGISHKSFRRITGMLLWLARQPPGQRNCSLFWVANRLKEIGLSDYSARDLLLPVAEIIGLDAREAERTISSAYRRHG